MISLLVGIAFFAVAASWSLASPPMSSPDDDFHLTSIVCSKDNSNFCIRQDETTVLVPKTLTVVPCYANVVDRGADCLRWEPEWTPTVRWNSPGSDRGTLYYSIMSWFVDDDLWQSILTIRLFNSLLAALVLAGTLFVVSMPARRGLALGVLTVMFPVGIFHIASTNPNGWAILGLSVFWLYLIEASRPHIAVSARLAFLVAAVVAAIVAVSGRSDSVIYLVASALAVLVMRWTALRRNWLWLIIAVLTLLSSALLGRVRISTAIDALLIDPPRLAGVITEWWPRFHLLDWPLLMHYVVGGATPVNMPYPNSYTQGVGWDSRVGIPIEFPSTVSILGLLAVAGVIWIGLSRYSARKLLAAGILLATIFAMSFGWVWLTEFRAWAQARYYVGPVMVLVGLLVFDSRRGPFLRKAQAVLLWGLVAVAGTAALKTVVGRTISGQALVPGHHWSVENNYTMWWWPNVDILWPPSPNYTVVIGGVSLAILAAALIHLSQRGVRSDWAKSDALWSSSR